MAARRGLAALRAHTLLLALLHSAQSSQTRLDQWDAAAEKAYGTLAAVDAAGRPSPEFYGGRVDRRGDGVVYAVAGSAEFARQEALPCVRHLARLEKEAGRRAVRFALFHDEVVDLLSDDDRKELRSFFDVALPGFARLRDPRVRVKAVKAHAWLFAPFQRFVYLDFDSRPCAPNFATELLGKLDGAGADALLHNQWSAQAALSGDAHYRAEHHSAVAAWAATPATEAALRWFVAAFFHMRPKRDQPALMVALRLAHDRRGFRHADVDNATFCRSQTSTVSCDAGCTLVHKPMKYDPGNLVVAAGLTGGPAVRRALAALKLVDAAPECADPSTETPRKCRVLSGRHWAEPGALAHLRAAYPRARAVVPTRGPDCLADEMHLEQLREENPPHALFELDLPRAAADPEHWRAFCAFVEAWSSCKTADLARVAAAWARRPDDCPLSVREI